MAGVANIVCLPTGGIGVVNHIGSSLIWSWYKIFKLHWNKGELEQLEGATQAAFELSSIAMDQYKKNDQSECFI